MNMLLINVYTCTFISIWGIANKEKQKPKPAAKKTKSERACEHGPVHDQFIVILSGQGITNIYLEMQLLSTVAP